MREFLLGFVLAIIVIAALVVVPHFLPQSTAPSAREAARQAELARRELMTYRVSMPDAAERANLEELKDADFEKLIAQKQERFEELGRQFSQEVSQVKRASAKLDNSGLPPSELKPVSTSASGLRSAVSAFESDARANAKLLEDADRSAREALSDGGDELEVGHIAGTVKLVKAEQTLGQARVLRADMTRLEALLLETAAKWADARAAADYHASIDVKGIEENLAADLETMQADVAKAQAEVTELGELIGRNGALLTETRENIATLRDKQVEMEDQGFTLGDDESFADYRERYRDLVERLRVLQEREHVLAFGGIEGGQVAGDDLVSGEIRGGTQVLGLDELKSQLARAETRLERYQSGVQALERQIAMMRKLDDEASSRRGDHEQRMSTLGGQIDQLQERLNNLANEAFDLEDKAISAAKEAQRAYATASRAAGKWISDASDLQRNKDPQRLNERLKRIINDKSIKPFGGAAEASAKLLEGRIQAERALALRDFANALQRVRTLVPENTADVAAVEEKYATAQEQAIEALNAAREGYERLTQQENNTSWLFESSLATVYHLLSLVDPIRGQDAYSNFVDRLGRVVQDRTDVTLRPGSGRAVSARERR